jgi:hypothetical protein
LIDELFAVLLGRVEVVMTVRFESPHLHAVELQFIELPGGLLHLDGIVLILTEEIGPASDRCLYCHFVSPSWEMYLKVFHIDLG